MHTFIYPDLTHKEEGKKINKNKKKLKKKRVVNQRDISPRVHLRATSHQIISNHSPRYETDE